MKKSGLIECDKGYAMRWCGLWQRCLRYTGHDRLKAN